MLDSELGPARARPGILGSGSLAARPRLGVTTGGDVGLGLHTASPSKSADSHRVRAQPVRPARPAAGGASGSNLGIVTCQCPSEALPGTVSSDATALQLACAGPGLAMPSRPALQIDSQGRPLAFQLEFKRPQPMFSLQRRPHQQLQVVLFSKNFSLINYYN